MTARRWLAALLGTWRGRFIAAFIAVQLVAPLHYYVMRHDRHDERFAWRMFSPMRFVVCSDPDDTAIKQVNRRRPPRFTVGDQAPVALDTVFHEAWIELARRGRYSVLERMGQTLCAANFGVPVKLEMACMYLDGTRENVTADDLCKKPEL